MKKTGKVILGVTIALVGVGIMINGFSSSESGNSSNSSSNTAIQTETEGNDGYATLDKFNAIETGMSYNDVVEIVGSEGTVMSESEVADIKSTIYYWYSKDGVSNMNIMVQNDSVISKAQVGLK